MFGGPDSVGFSKAVRSILRKYILHVEAKAYQSAKPLSTSDLDEIIKLNSE